MSNLDRDLDDLDGICGFTDGERLRPTRDGDEVLGLVLFGDIDWTNRAAVEERKSEWRLLFGHRGRRIGRRFDA